MEKFRKNEKEKIIVQAMPAEECAEYLIIPPRKVDEYYQTHQAEFTTQDSIHLRMLVLKKDSTARRRAARRWRRNSAEDRGRADFGKMAEMYSEDASQGAQGDWGWLTGTR